MSDENEIRVGDRFERLAPGRPYEPGDIAVVRALFERSRDWAYIQKESGGWGESGDVTGEVANPMWWRRLPREQAAAPQNIEERRAALKVGDIITDFALLCPGMRLRRNFVAVRPDEALVAKVERYHGDVMAAFDRDGGLLVAQGAPVMTDGRLVFLGMVDEEKPAAKCKAAVCGYRSDVLDGYCRTHWAEAGRLCNAEQCDFHGVEHDCVRARHRKSTAPKCAHGCSPAAPCMRDVCPAHKEAAVAVRMAERERMPRITADETEAAIWRGARWSPSPTGLGGLAGRYRYGVS